MIHILKLLLLLIVHLYKLLYSPYTCIKTFKNIDTKTRKSEEKQNIHKMNTSLSWSVYVLQAFMTLFNNALRVLAINSVGDFILFLGKIGVMAATAAVGIVWLKVGYSPLISFMSIFMYIYIYLHSFGYQYFISKLNLYSLIIESKGNILLYEFWRTTWKRNNVKGCLFNS